MDACIRSLWFAAGRHRQRISQHRFFISLVLVCVAPLVTADLARSADLRTTNFIVNAPTPDLARAVGDAAERFRRDLAVYWLGEELAPWPNPCPIRVVAGSNLAAQGVTTYNRSPVRDFQMEVVGSPQRILDSVLPHEVTHTVLATYFGRPLPRWADEGICTTVEHASERQKHETKLREFLRSRRGIAMNKLFLMTEYPSDVLPMYAQGYSVCQFLIAQQGPRTLVTFLGDYMQQPSWTHHVREHYGYESLAELQEAWLAWVADGSGPVDAYVKNPAASTTTLAAAGGSTAPDSAASDSGVALASSTKSENDEGWYSRLRQEAINGRSEPQRGPSQRGQTPKMKSSTAPPPLHSVSQPQPEQGLAPGGVIPGGGPPALATPGAQGGAIARGNASAGEYRPGSLSTSGSYWR